MGKGSRSIGKCIKSKEIICPIRMVNVNTLSDFKSIANHSYVWLTLLIELPNGTAKAVDVPMRDKDKWIYGGEIPASSEESDRIHFIDGESYAKVKVELWENKSEKETSIVIRFIEAYLNRNMQFK